VSKKIAKVIDELKNGVNGMTNGNNGWDQSVRVDIVQLLNDLEKFVKKIGRVTK